MTACTYHLREFGSRRIVTQRGAQGCKKQRSGPLAMHEKAIVLPRQTPDRKLHSICTIVPETQNRSARSKRRGRMRAGREELGRPQSMDDGGIQGEHGLRHDRQPLPQSTLTAAALAISLQALEFSRECKPGIGAETQESQQLERV